MTRTSVDTWLVAALAPSDRVLLLGPGWEEVARALAGQGVDVAVDTAGDRPWPPGVHQLDPASVPDPRPVVGASLDAPRSLPAAVAVATDRVVTRLELTGAADLAALGGSWPLGVRSQLCVDTAWLATWDVVDEPGHELTGQLLAALHTTATGLQALAGAAVEDRDARARAAGVARRRQAAAEARARTTATLADRWTGSQEALIRSLSAPGPADGSAPPLDLAPTPGRGPGRLASGLRSLLGSRGGPSPAPTTPAGAPPRGRAAVTPGWRVAAVAGEAADWLAAWVGATVVVPSQLAPDELPDHVGGHLDLLVVGHVEEAERPAATALARAARDAGAAVVGIASGEAPWDGFGDLCDLVVADAPGRPGPRTLAAPPPVDPAVVNPTVGFQWRGRGLVTVCTGSEPDLGDVRAELAALGVDAELVGPGTDVALPRDPAGRARQLGRRGGVVDVPTAHTSVAEHARTLVGLAAAGIPVAAPDLPGRVRALLGPVLADTLATARVDDLDDPNHRERTSVRQRRAALWTHTAEARWRRIGRALDLPVPPRPPVSAVVVTNRPDHLDHCAAQLSRQTYRPLEVVLGLHGSRFTPDQVEAFVDRVGLPVTGVPIDDHRTLGEGLTLACQAAGGTIIAKWDDDDHYGPDHLVDLVQALQYSGATIVGKGAEFIHLGQLDLTIRRFSGRAESGSRSLAGGTLALHRDDLAEAGWWRRIPRGVDQALLDDVLRTGGRIHRTHGFEFVLARRAAGHTWSVDVDYFLGQSEGQWRGLARDVAGLDDSVLARPSDLPAPG